LLRRSVHHVFFRTTQSVTRGRQTTRENVKT